MTYLELIKYYYLEDIWREMLTFTASKRLVHIKGVIETAYELAKRYGADCRNAVVAAIFHDWFRGSTDSELNKRIEHYGLSDDLKNKANLSHGWLAAELMKERYGIADEDLLNAVRYHTTGRAAMSLLEKVVFIADAIEPSRSFADVPELRRLATVDLDRAMVRALKDTLDYVREKGEILDESTLHAYQYYL